ncbi:MAG TPA: lipoyl domain-containing protein [Candidatus Omnitrophota bacterium]|nr:lipoyl domain-containing protein [Candidatus Omnitrophota bacterium]HPT07564.1 lipoyl domain-containing protein [Candidatus Omnitrophota bacterium]
MAKIVLPELGEGITKATVSYWYFNEGDTISEKDDVVELATDKATFNVPAPCAGILAQILFQEGDTVSIGDVLAVIQEG